MKGDPRGRTRGAPSRRRLLAPLAAVVAALAAVSSALADDFGAHQPGQHVYDRAGVLVASQTADLELQATALEQAGVPTIVYVRLKAADYPTSRQDARDLMDAWQVESSSGAKDGLIVFLNLQPDAVGHGSAALVAGAHHVDDGRLSGDRLQQIYDYELKPKMAAGDIAAGIAGALQEAADDLREPAPTSQSSQGSVSASNHGWGLPGWLGFGIFVVGLAVAVPTLIVALRGGWFGGFRDSSADPGQSNGYSGDSGGSTSSTGDSSGSTSSGSDSGGGSF